MRLDIYGLVCEIHSNSDIVLSGLERDFNYFKTPNSQTQPDFQWELFAESPPESPERFPRFTFRDFTIYQKRGVRQIEYDQGAALSIFDFKSFKGRIYCPDQERLQELAYLAILSRVGEALDRRGLHRVHALGFEYAGFGGVVLLPSGGGKSTLALELLRSQAPVGFFSEDTPLICRHGLLHAFPLRWSFRTGAKLDWIPKNFIRPFHRKNYGDKSLLDVNFFSKQIRSGLPLRWVIVGQRTSRAVSSLGPASFARGVFVLFKNLVIGLGVPQMAEYRLRFGLIDLTRLAQDAYSRLKALKLMLGQSSVYSFSLGDDPSESVVVLLGFLKNNQSPLSNAQLKINSPSPIS